MPTARSSLDRFVRGAMLASGDGDPIARGFAILAAVAKPGYTRWSIVYDLGASEVYFKTDTDEAIRRFTGTGFDFSCRTPVKILDVTAPGSGDVATVFVDCHSMYRKEGPAQMRCLGETEFANGVAATSASG